MTVTLKTKTITVPDSVRQQAGFKVGQVLEFKARGGVVTIIPKLPTADGEYTPAQRRAIDRGVAQSLKEYKHGKAVGPFETHAEFIASLRGPAKRSPGKKTKRAAR
jgi:bifunctional DNA-binding transcriptional regulator/antitoxin component of YhaV-PrlF toxin-antitoxin module